MKCAVQGFQRRREQGRPWLLVPRPARLPILRNKRKLIRRYLPPQGCEPKVSKALRAGKRPPKEPSLATHNNPWENRSNNVSGHNQGDNCSPFSPVGASPRSKTL